MFEGQGVPLDLVAAKEWLTKAKEQGHGISEKQLDIMVSLRQTPVIIIIDLSSFGRLDGIVKRQNKRNRQD